MNHCQKMERKALLPDNIVSAVNAFPTEVLTASCGAFLCTYLVNKCISSSESLFS